MTILDRARGSRRIRIDTGQFADDIAKRMPDLDDVDLGKARDAAGSAISDVIDRAGDAMRNLRSDIEKTGDKVPDKPLDELGKRIRSVASKDTVDEVASRIEKSLPDTDKDRYLRAFERGRVQTRTRYVVVGAAAGITAGILGVVFLDPKQGKARRDALAQKATSVGKQVSEQVAGKVKYAQDRARGMAIERGIVKPDRGPVGVMDPVAAPAWPSTEGPLDQPLDDPQFGAHEALPEDLVGAGQGSDGEVGTHPPRG